MRPRLRRPPGRNNVREILAAGVDQIFPILQVAHAKKDWATLGHASFANYVKAEYHGWLPRFESIPQRTEVIKELVAAGIPQRDVGAMTGTSGAAVNRAVNPPHVPSETLAPPPSERPGILQAAADLTDEGIPEFSAEALADRTGWAVSTVKTAASNLCRGGLMLTRVGAAPTGVTGCRLSLPMPRRAGARSRAGTPTARSPNLTRHPASLPSPRWIGRSSPEPS